MLYEDGDVGKLPFEGSRFRRNLRSRYCIRNQPRFRRVESQRCSKDSNRSSAWRWRSDLRDLRYQHASGGAHRSAATEAGYPRSGRFAAASLEREFRQRRMRAAAQTMWRRAFMPGAASSEARQRSWRADRACARRPPLLPLPPPNSPSLTKTPSSSPILIIKPRIQSSTTP